MSVNPAGVDSPNTNGWTIGMFNTQAKTFRHLAYKLPGADTWFAAMVDWNSGPLSMEEAAPTHTGVQVNPHWVWRFTTVRRMNLERHDCEVRAISYEDSLRLKSAEKEIYWPSYQSHVVRHANPSEAHRYAHMKIREYEGLDKPQTGPHRHLAVHTRKFSHWSTALAPPEDPQPRTPVELQVNIALPVCPEDCVEGNAASPPQDCCDASPEPVQA